MVKDKTRTVVRFLHISNAVLCLLITGSVVLAQQAGSTASKAPAEKLLPGFVKGDVVSYSYVPNRYWSLKEGIGKCPYLFEYGLMKWDGRTPLEEYHQENIRRIDLASQWSTCVGLSNRYAAWNDEIINLMIRCFKNRQLIILSARTDSKPGKEKDYFSHLVAILEKLWADRDKTLVSPEGDKATGRQLISNIFIADTGDEGLSGLKTEGLYALNERVRKEIKERVMDGERPFRHIKTWYNEMHYGMGTYAANEEDLNKERPDKGSQKWPANSEFIGVDTYHYWSFQHHPFDPHDPNIPHRRVIEQEAAWQNIITRYYGPDFRVTRGDKWDRRNKNDTHAMIQAIDLAKAKQAMMIYIANSDNIPGSSYTTPIETMDAFYDSIKAGPWVGLAWWVFDNDHEGCRTLDYLDKTLKRYTPEQKKGMPYSPQELDRWREQFIASRMRMFNDVVYNQFGYLNGPAPNKHNR